MFIKQAMMRFFIKNNIRVFLIYIFVLLPFSVHASIVVFGTRVVFPSDAKEITVKLTNNSENPILIQSWIDKGDPKVSPENIDTPFVITPPITRVEGKEGQTLRIYYDRDNSLPSDKESIFWLNVLEVPPIANDGENKIKIAVHTRIKLFFRPKSIIKTQLPKENYLDWSIKTNGAIYTLNCQNKSPYYVSLRDVKIGNDEIKLNIDNALVAPGGHQQFILNSEVRAVTKLKYTVINDDGNGTLLEKNLAH